MSSRPLVIFELPGTKIDILDGLDACGLGVVSVSSLGSIDIPYFTRKYVLYRKYAISSARHVKSSTIAVPNDAYILKAETVFGIIQNEEEDFVRESLELHLTFQSETGLCGAQATLIVLGPFPEIPEGKFCPPSEGGIH